MFIKVRRKWTERMASREFGEDSCGSTAVEFAIVAPVFLMLMFSIFEVGWFFFANSVVDATVGDAARQIKTGQIQKSFGDNDDKYDKMYDNICDVLSVFGGCENRLTIEVDTYDTFAELAADNTPPTCADAPPDDVAAIPFNPGDELQIVRARICYIYTTLNPAIGVNLSEPGTNKRRLVSTAIFRNEPYELNNRED
ncbi:MAG: pilus biosynthesis protein TadE [Hyphococcus sp.]|nr:MAG: pilus biosynthesis protein TadE [Marinicaulis sp.]